MIQLLMNKKKSTITLLSTTWTDLEMGDAVESNLPIHTALIASNVPESLIETALANGALPRFEHEGGTSLILLRVFDEAAGRRAESARALTRKLALLVSNGKVYSVHHFSAADLPRIFSSPGEALQPEAVLKLIAERVNATFSEAITHSENTVNEIEAHVFHQSGRSGVHLKDAYFLKRRLSIQKKILSMNREAIENASIHFPQLARSVPLRKMTRTIALADSLLEELNQLLQLQLALVSQKTNEAMRVLAVFSAFFLPLSFIAGVYGMNFEAMPELHHPYGYIGSLALMGAVATVIYFWFKRRRWIGSNA